MEILLGLLRAGQILEWEALVEYKQYDCVFDEERNTIYVSKVDNNKGVNYLTETHWMELPDLFDGEVIV